MTMETTDPHDTPDVRRAESLFLVSLVFSMSAWMPGCDSDSGDDTKAPATDGDASTGGEPSTDSAASMSGRASTSPSSTSGAMSTANGSATDEGMTTGDTAGTDPTDPPSTADGGAQTGGDTRSCVALAETLDGCGYEDPEYYREYCEYILSYVEAEYGDVCASAWSDWYACLAGLSCVEIENEGNETKACATGIPDECPLDGSDNGGSLE